MKKRNPKPLPLVSGRLVSSFAEIEWVRDLPKVLLSELQPLPTPAKRSRRGTGKAVRP